MDMTCYNPGFHLMFSGRLLVFGAHSDMMALYQIFVHMYLRLIINVGMICFIVVWSWQGLVRQRKTVTS